MYSESLYLSTVFFAGILSFLSPCILPLLPVYFSIFASNDVVQDYKQSKSSPWLSLVLRTLLFVGGIAFCFVLLGFGAGALGSVINSDVFLIAMGAIVVIMGIHQTGLIKIKRLYQEKTLHMERAKRRDGIGIFLLGFTFSFGWTPCVGPVLAAILALSAGSGTALYGGFLMAIYSLGFAIPFVILALFSKVLLSKMKSLHQHLNKIKIVSGIVIILMGILLMTNGLNKITVWLGGF